LAAKKDTEVLSGDVITTGGTSNAQVRFKDGAVVAFRPETEFRVDEYKYSGKPDGTEKAAVSLVKGGVRAVTGVIGRSNRDNLKVNAVVATVGIRGTGFNITFCDAGCKAANPNAAEGLYAGVFEGKVAVSNKGGSTSDLGVNRFAYVRDETSAPVQLIAPPSFLKDSLESQARVRPKIQVLNSNSDDSAELINAVATSKAPVDATIRPALSATLVQNIPTPLAQVDLVRNLPAKFFETDVGEGAFGAVSASIDPSNKPYLRAAEYSGRATGATAILSQISLNTEVGQFAYGTESYKVTQVNSSDYVIGNPYTAKWREGGTSGNVVSWGRWAGDDMKIGNYGTISLTENQGWHYIVGIPLGALPTDTNTRTMTLIGGTKPTEARVGATNGWRLTGGDLTVNFANRNLSGSLLLYYGGETGYGTFKTAYSGAVGDDPKALNSYASSTLRTSGSSDLCSASCSGKVSLGFYGTPDNLRAGATYAINTGANGVVQGAAIYK